LQLSVAPRPHGEPPPHTWVEWNCSQLLQNTPLHPIAEWGRIRFGCTEVPAERRLADLENTPALIKLDPAENAPLLAPLLDIPRHRNDRWLSRRRNYGADNWRRSRIGQSQAPRSTRSCWCSKIFIGPTRPQRGIALDKQRHPASPFRHVSRSRA
jgi:hypothetical protein